MAGNLHGDKSGNTFQKVLTTTSGSIKFYVGLMLPFSLFSTGLLGIYKKIETVRIPTIILSKISSSQS